MKRNIWNIIGALALVGLVALLIAAAAHADPKSAPAGPYVTGSIAVDTPIISAPDRSQDRTTEGHLYLQCHNLIGRLCFVGGGDLQFHRGFPYDSENKLYGGFELPVGGGVTPYFTFERRFDVGDNRYVAGIRWSFDSRG